MSFSPTPEQLDIVAAARDTKDNLIITALAGAAKTSTLVLIAEALPKTQILCLAFNKKIALEMQERLPKNCTAQTLNSLGHRAWASALGQRLTLDTKKTYDNLSALIGELKQQKEKDFAYENMAHIMRAIEFGKSCGYIPTGHYPTAKRLMDDDEFFAHLEEAPTELEERLIRDATFLSLKQAFAGQIDFSDQILMPTVFGASFDPYPLVMVDEFQDFSLLNHKMLRKIVKRRLIAVGDPCQSIYGFRGAHQDSMEHGRKAFEMTGLRLTVSFRCPQAVVREARWRAPEMKFPDWAAEGEVTHLREWTAADLPDNAAIICRNNAPLFSTAIKLLKNGRYPELVGNDIGKSLIKTLRKLGDAKTSQADVLQLIAAWREAKLKKSRNSSSVKDQAACLEIFALQGETLADAITYAEHIMAMRGPIQLMTGHKSKGLEFDNVFFLEDKLLNMTDEQDRNLRYVIQTRAKQTLTYIDMEGFVDQSGSED